MTLKEITEALRASVVLSQLDPGDFPHKNGPSMQIKQNEAKEEAKRLRTLLHKELSKAVALIAVAGPTEKRDEFQKVVEDEGSCFVYDATELYREFATAIEGGMNQRERYYDTAQALRLI